MRFYNEFLSFVEQINRNRACPPLFDWKNGAREYFMSREGMMQAVCLGFAIEFFISKDSGYFFQGAHYGLLVCKSNKENSKFYDY